MSAQEHVRALHEESPFAPRASLFTVQGDPAGKAWLRVRQLAPGSEVTVTMRQTQPDERYFVAADETRAVFLNLTDEQLSAPVMAALRRIATEHASDLERATAGGSIVFDHIRLTDGGVVWNGRRVADLQQVIETRARDDVIEMTTRRKGRGFWGHLGPVGGFFVGAMATGYGAGLTCQAVAGRGRCDTGAFLTGAVLGGVVGAAYGLGAANRESQEVIYRAP